MAKKSFNISSTLKKNKASLEPQLPEKVELKKKARNFDDIKEKVEEIHEKVTPAKEVETPVSQPKSKAPVPAAEMSSPPAPTPAKRKPIPTKRKPTNTVKERMVRMTIDTPEDLHRKLKIKSIEKGLSMRDYILRLIDRDMKKG